MDKSVSKEASQRSFIGSSSHTSVQDTELEIKKPKKKKKLKSQKGLTRTTHKLKAVGSGWFREQAEWRAYVRAQQRDLRRVKPVVDDAAPRLNVTPIYDVEVLKAIWSGLKATFDVNVAIVKNLHLINIGHGKTDTFTYNYSKPVSSNYATRRSDAKYIEKRNKALLKTLRKPQTRMTTVKEYAEEWKRHEAEVENAAQFPLWWKLKKKEAAAIEVAPPFRQFKQHITEKSAKYPDKRPRVLLEVSIKNGGVVGKMVAVLYSDYVPMTVKNFLAFCDPKAPLTYKGNLFYLIFQNYYCQTGDVVENRGFGGTSIYGPYFGNEDLTLKHKDRGILTMYSTMPNRNGSQFLITFRKLESLDGHNVAFGKIVKGLHVLDTIEGLGSKKTGRPKVEIFISDCDEI